MGCPYKAIGDKNRRKILTILGEKDTSAGDIAHRFKITQPTISNHIRILKEARLIKERRVKQSRIYSLNKLKLETVIKTLQKISE